MSNLRHFPNPYHDHEDDPGVLSAPDNAKLQKLLGDLIEATSTTPGDAYQKEIRIRNFRSERLELTDDLIVVLEERKGHYLANSYDTGQYGYGHSPDDAIADLCSVMEDYYDLLNEDEERLIPHLRAHLRYLRTILRERA